MLTRLFIQNIALIDKLEFDLGSGLNILTGETGAGKSIVIDSITAIIGGRVSKDIIRTGADKAIIEAMFILNDSEKISELKEQGFDIDEDNTVLIVREIYQNGKNVCKVNGRMVTVSMLRTLGEKLVDIHGQNDNQSLLIPENHIEFLDNFIGEKINKIKAEYASKLVELKKIKNELHSITGDPEEMARKLDLLNFQMSEITNAKLRPGEEEELSEKKLVISNSEKISLVLSNSYESLYGSGANLCPIIPSLNNIIKEFGQITFTDDKYANASNALLEISYNLEEISRDIRMWKEEMEFNPQQLEEIEERLDIISNLKRKYGKDIPSILSYNEKIIAEMDELTNSEEHAKELHSEIVRLNNELFHVSKKLSELRIQNGKILAEKIEHELTNLEMKNTKLIVKIDFDDKVPADGIYSFNKNGLDKVEFFISPNVGENMKPLFKIASGGEMSRIMLAIKTILAGVDRKSTLIFDEIDSGISGRAAYAVSEKLAYISKNHQVICVTHQAQIAAMADNHFVIKKIVSNGKTLTTINHVDGMDKEKAIARIMGSENISEITLKHANEILQNAALAKETLRVQ